jgi:hypothetical protein
MTKHTPGPWYVRGAPAAYQHEKPRDITSGHSLIATACMLNNFRGETLANARLIAAAPDMLEALRTIVEYGPQSGMKADAPMLIAARASIAKAEGRS